MAKRRNFEVVEPSQMVAADLQDSPVEITETPEIPSNAETATEPDEPAAKKVESKADKFRRLAPKRVMKAVKSMRAVANVMNRRVYEYTPEQEKKVRAALWKVMEEIDLAITGGKKSEDEFTL